MTMLSEIFLSSFTFLGLLFEVFLESDEIHPNFESKNYAVMRAEKKVICSSFVHCFSRFSSSGVYTKPEERP